MMRQAVGVGLERGVAQRAVLEQHRHRLRRACRLRRKQLRQRQRRRQTVAASAAPASPSPGAAPEPAGPYAGECAVSFQRAQDGVALGLAQDRRPPERTAAGSATAAPSSRTSRSPRRRDRRRVEQVAGVFQHAVDAGRRRLGRAPLDQPERQVELRARGRHRLRPHRKPRQLEPAVRRAPPRTPASPGTADAATATAPD